MNGLAPPFAFGVYLLLALLLLWLGRALAGPAPASGASSMIYAGGELPESAPAAPGYRAFSAVALFFALLHLGVLVAGTGAIGWIGLAYLAGLLVVLLVVVLG